jgi:hypothetical protein
MIFARMVTAIATSAIIASCFYVFTTHFQCDATADTRPSTTLSMAGKVPIIVRATQRRYTCPNGSSRWL